MKNNSKEILKRELSVLYPGFTDEELNEMVLKLIKFFVLSLKALKSIETQEQNNNKHT